MFCLLSVFFFLLAHNWIRTNKEEGTFSWAQGHKIRAWPQPVVRFQVFSGARYTYGAHNLYNKFVRTEKYRVRVIHKVRIIDGKMW
jgi:hypothetical protein